MKDVAYIHRDYEVGVSRGPFWQKHLRHPVFGCLGLRPIMAQHPWAEDGGLQRWVKGRRQIVEIGVAEGASALTLRRAMPPDGVLTLIDPFHLSRFRPLNSTRRLARSALGGCQNGVIWIEEFSSQAVRNWTGAIDFLFIDGDHAEAAVRQDWDDWHSFVAPGGLVVFHDARLFPGGWVTPEYGPVKVVHTLFRTKSHPDWEIVEEVDSLVAVKRQRLSPRPFNHPVGS